jgi:hypothetical protein
VAGSVVINFALRHGTYRQAERADGQATRDHARVVFGTLPAETDID